MWPCSFDRESFDRISRRLSRLWVHVCGSITRLIVHLGLEFVFLGSCFVLTVFICSISASTSILIFIFISIVTRFIVDLVRGSGVVDCNVFLGRDFVFKDLCTVLTVVPLVVYPPS